MRGVNGVLAVFDIDGCLVPAREAPADIGALTELRALSQAHGRALFTFATGRSAMYALAFAELLDVRLPFVAEHGAILFDPITFRRRFTSREAWRTWSELREEVLRRLAPILPHVRLEPLKEATLSLHPLERTEGSVKALHEALAERLHDLPLTLLPSNIAVDIAVAGVDKGQGVAALVAEVGADAKHLLAVGDSPGDLPFLRLASFAAAPQNAHEDVVALVSAKGEDGFVAPSPFTRGVLESLRWFQERLGR